LISCIEWIFLIERSPSISIFQTGLTKTVNAGLLSLQSHESLSCRSQPCAELYRICVKPDCWKLSSDTESMAVKAACSIHLGKDEKQFPPPRGNYTCLLTGATCHDERRRRTSHLKNYHSRKKNTYANNDNGEQDMKMA